MRTLAAMRIALALFSVCALMLIATSSVLAQEQGTTQSQQELGAIASALSIGMSCIGAGYAVGKTGTAAIGAVTERPEVFGKAIIFVGLAEGIAIYGLLIAILLVP
ncbi:MAG: ATP synthase subunit C [Candidatus Korarchaeota archaeon]|nr:ATP synthase subunit C [Thermoproteota archaeon]